LLFTDALMLKVNRRHLTDLVAPTRPTMKVLYMSGCTDDTMVRHSIQDAGANFLPKPFTPVGLAWRCVPCSMARTGSPTCQAARAIRRSSFRPALPEARAALYLLACHDDRTQSLCPIGPAAELRHTG